MQKMKIAVIGAGSSYTPELFEKLSEYRERLPVGEVALMDVDPERLSIMEGFCKRFCKKLGFDVNITATGDRLRAIDGADFIDVQLRVGKNAARVFDEKIPLKYGIVGQETTGPGGMMKAFRTIPVMLEIAGDVVKHNPSAWIINYTNPTGLVTEAVAKYTTAKIAGLCSGGFAPRWLVADALKVDEALVHYDYVGLNHLNFAYDITIGGRQLSGDEFKTILGRFAEGDREWIDMLGMIPSGYLQYYVHAGKKVKELTEAPLTRGETIGGLEKEIFVEYADESVDSKPASLKKRGGGGYSEVAIGVMDAIYNNRDRWMVINVPNNGTLKFLPDDAVIETACTVNAAGVKPLAPRRVPSEVWGLIAAVKNYEQLAVEAAVHSDKNKALLALLAHPLVGDLEIAVPMLDELLEANKRYLRFG
ncbi:MAG: 6-phospho-beta-glucosidase [Defluviitaleaceae bacterium]|nr:6-phospho-beta-glucosidase [Defluviitaleaceae bacterium]